MYLKKGSVRDIKIDLDRMQLPISLTQDGGANDSVGPGHGGRVNEGPILGDRNEPRIYAVCACGFLFLENFLDGMIENEFHRLERHIGIGFENLAVLLDI